MLARFQVLFSLLALFLSGAFASSNTTFYSNTTSITTPTLIVTAPPSIATGSSSGNITAVNSTSLLVTPTPTASSASTPSSVNSNAAGSNSGYLNGAVVGVVALGAVFVSL